jgi:hypothetical protein
MSGERPVPRRSMWLLTLLTLVMVAACAAAGAPATDGAPPATAKAPAGASPATENGTAGASPATENAAAGASPTTAAGGAPPVTPSATAKPDCDYWATPQPVVDKMLELARVKASDVVYDLGCGDARSLVTAAQRYGARGVGFDIDPRLVAEARRNVRRNGVENLVQIEEADIFTVDLSPADVIFLYLVPRLNLRLVPQLEKLRPGSRIVSHEYEIPGARPTRIVKVPGSPNGPPGADLQPATVMHKIYLWKMPWQKQATDWSTE